MKDAGISSLPKFYSQVIIPDTGIMKIIVILIQNNPVGFYF
jgi:hypothetical protein